MSSQPIRALLLSSLVGLAVTDVYSSQSRRVWEEIPCQGGVCHEYESPAAYCIQVGDSWKDKRGRKTDCVRRCKVTHASVKTPKLSDLHGGFCASSSRSLSEKEEGYAAAGHVNAKRRYTRTTRNNEDKECTAFPRLLPHLRLVVGSSSAQSAMFYAHTVESKDEKQMSIISHTCQFTRT
ncbi:hypothetical protein WMY93_002963 [Mugilogobius chulae]|uniref:Secreted protein n=1 Tax=Mugilogobius chulae TaxID=88201 RepID=A0AAW0Q546_9GOBI